MRGMFATGAAAAALLGAGCVETVGSLQTRPIAAPVEGSGGPAQNASAATWRMPGPLSPLASYSAGGEEIVITFVPEAGQVRGTRTAIASLGAPLTPAPGRNRTVEACRAVTQAEAAKLGAREVEAVSAGPDRRNEKGQFVGPVRMRITYVRPTGYEVRLADMTCVVDAKGKIVDAFA